MTSKKKDQLTNKFYLRVYDDEVLQSMYELYDTGQFDSMNELITKALSIGIDKIYTTFGKRKALSNSNTAEPVQNDKGKFDELVKRVKGLEMSVEDIFVMQNIIEMLTTTLYNTTRSQIAGQPVSIELLDSGYLAMLPEGLQAVKNELIKRTKTKNKE